MASESRKAKAEQEARAEARADAEEDARGKRLWKLLNAGVALVAGLITAKALDATWKTATGHKPPDKPEHPDIGSREALFWAALSGLAVGVMKTYASRRAATYWVKSTGRLPPGMPAEAYEDIAEKTA